MDITPELVEAELEKLRDLPTPVAWWEVRTGLDSTDDPAVWVWAMLEDEDADFATVSVVRRKVRDLVRDVTRRQTGTAWWPYVHFRGVSEVERPS